MFMVLLVVIIYIGSFSNVPAYTPSKTCSHATTTMITTSTSSAITSSSHTVSPQSTGQPHHAHGSFNSDNAIEVGAPLAGIVILIIVVIISCVAYRRLVQLMMYTVICSYSYILLLHSQAA